MAMHLYKVLERPLITEKNSALQAQGKYVFKVAQEANKEQIKQAVEKAFKVTVTGVNLMTVSGKRRRMRGREVTSPSWKKALVTLKSGDKIELFEGV
jgi:large subunit ribosomal protein L23